MWISHVFIFQSIAGPAGCRNCLLVGRHPSQTFCKYWSVDTLKVDSVQRFFVIFPPYQNAMTSWDFLIHFLFHFLRNFIFYSTFTRLSLTIGHASSKREYLLAQIRQKDAIIESLLKQVCRLCIVIAFTISDILQLHNPYLATPLSIASYRMATSPIDQKNHSVLSWLDRLQSSVRDAGSSAGPEIFTELRNREEVESDSASDTPNIEFGDEELEDDGDTSETEKIQNTLPDAHVPLGLIAKLSIDNSHVKGKKDRTQDVKVTDEDLNDDNVVRLCCKDYSQPPDWPSCF